MPNFLEQLVAEWYEFRGYFVRRNVHVGRRAKGGWEAELDIVAFHPEQRHLVHIEPSMDALHWDRREVRFAKKFKAGQDHIPDLFCAFEPLPEIEHIALFVFGSGERHPKIGGGKVLMIKELMTEIRQELKKRSVAKSAVPEQFVILRALQFASDFWH